ncbi:glycosyl hydrolase family 18 protein [Thiotrichales bacterium 19S9-12]|nr:glycosyl hydrolase family 18 protein [Thiotrichales bacterium 19S9-11]MCF6811207.1 glycosyl hydrolase family 18 protein [Thiotrichales bacterium 19S9-12]
MKKICLMILSLFLFSSVYADYKDYVPCSKEPDSLGVPQAGSFYPIYNSGENQYIEPKLWMPFEKVSTLYLAFAHAYPYPSSDSKAAILKVEEGQPDESNRIKEIVKIAKKANPKIKILISLGWNTYSTDWGYINNDYVSGTNLFPKSIVHFIMKYNLDGFDIDDESVHSSVISQENFTAVMKNIRRELDMASKQLGRTLYFTITPAGGIANVTADNQMCFNMINTQNYGGSYPYQFTSSPLNVPGDRLAAGYNSEGCHEYRELPSSDGIAGLFNWSFSADSNCVVKEKNIHGQTRTINFKYTREIAKKVDYRVVKSK